MPGFTLPESFPIVGLGVVGAVALYVYQFSLVTKARKESGVKYPNLYCTDAEALADPKKMKFNCIQRAHANTLENLPYMIMTSVYLSLFHPKFATGSFLLWIFGRFFYTANYATGIPKNRNNGIAIVAYLGLAGCLFGSIGVALIKAYEILF